MNPNLLKLTSSRNNVLLAGYAFIDFDANNKALSYSVFQGVDTIYYRLIFKKHNVTTAIQEVTKNISFSVYPNPTSDEINISSTYNIGKVEIYNITGILQSSSYKNKVDVSNLSSGIYFVKVYSENGVATQKFVKQ